MIPYDMLLFLSFIFLLCVLAVTLVHISLRSKRERELLNARIELETRLIDRATSLEGIEQYLSAGGLTKLDQSLRFPRDRAYMRFIGPLAAGCGLTLVGGILLVTFAFRGLLINNAFLIPSVLVLAIGLALLLVGFIIHRASRRWGLIDLGPEQK